jgi:hypothetical protein
MVLVAATASTPSPALTQESPVNNAAALKQYFEPKSVTRLEWDLMDFNIWWKGSFVSSDNYITSFPVTFDPKALRFRTIFSVHEKRYYNDPEPFFQLPRPRREAVLQTGIEQLKELLGQSFPELKSNPRLLYVEFKFRSPSGGTSAVAKYENGTLRLSE